MEGNKVIKTINGEGNKDIHHTSIWNSGMPGEALLGESLLRDNDHCSVIAVITDFARPPIKGKWLNGAIMMLKAGISIIQGHNREGLNDKKRRRE